MGFSDVRDWRDCAGDSTGGEAMNQIDWLIYAKQMIHQAEQHEMHKRYGMATLATYEAIKHLENGCDILKRAHAAQMAQRRYEDDYAQVERESALG